VQSADQSPEQDVVASGAAMPPHPLDMRWYVHIEGKTYGPYSEHEIREMVEQHRVAGSALVYAEGGHAPAWLQIANDPILGALFKSAETATSQLAPRDDDTSPRSRKWLFAIPVLLAVMAWIAWPYYAAYDLAVGLRDGDVATLETRVAWDSVRQGLRGDLSAVLISSVRAQDVSSSGEALGSALGIMLGPVLIDRIIDSYITPQHIAAARRADRNDGAAQDDAATPKALVDAMQAATNIRFDQIKYAFFSGSPLKFRINFVPDQNPALKQPFEFRFQWDGSWKLTRVVLPSDLIDSHLSVGGKK
jgi:Protein of unknown function (DUF2939)/GYF domain 2